MNQNEQILFYLKQGNKITSLEALELFKCFRLASRISDLNRLGYSITSEMITTSTGKRVSQYSLSNAEIKPLLCKSMPKQITRTPEHGC
jgi:hypothetical protein